MYTYLHIYNSCIYDDSSDDDKQHACKVPVGGLRELGHWINSCIIIQLIIHIHNNTTNNTTCIIQLILQLIIHMHNTTTNNTTYNYYVDTLMHNNTTNNTHTKQHHTS